MATVGVASRGQHRVSRRENGRKQFLFFIRKAKKSEEETARLSPNARDRRRGKETANAGTRPVRIRAGRGSREARNGVNRTVTPTTNTTRTVRARRGLNIVPRARPWSATRAPMRDKLKNIALCFSATAGSTGRAYLGLRDLDTVEGGGAEGARGARLGRGDAGREDSDRGDDGSHGCVCWSDECQSRSLLVFWLHSAIFWRDNLKRRKTPATVD